MTLYTVDPSDARFVTSGLTSTSFRAKGFLVTMFGEIRVDDVDHVFEVLAMVPERKEEVTP